jgi:hypothetical protein
VIRNTAIEIVAKRHSATRSKGKGPADWYLKVADKRIAVDVMTPRSQSRVAEPRLRFDRVAVGLVARLQATLSSSVPNGRTLVVTITAPIRQDSKTGAALEEKLRELLTARRAWLKTVIHGNRAEVRVLRGATGQTSRLIGFVHNPDPGPGMLFDVTQSLLARMRSGKRSPTRARWLVIDNQDGLSPVKTYCHVCSALRAWTVFKRILVAEPGGRVTNLPRI